MPKKEITCTEILLVHEYRDGNAAYAQRLRVCKWNGGSPVLELRNVKYEEDGTMKMLKASGIKGETMEMYVIPNMDAIMEALDS